MDSNNESVSVFYKPLFTCESVFYVLIVVIDRSTGEMAVSVVYYSHCLLDVVGLEKSPSAMLNFIARPLSTVEICN